jgi:hypothetical protein
MAKKWISEAISRPGSLKRTLGVSKTTGTIPKKKLAAAAKKGGVTGKRARLAQTLAGFARKKKATTYL